MKTELASDEERTQASDIVNAAVNSIHHRIENVQFDISIAHTEVKKVRPLYSVFQLDNSFTDYHPRICKLQSAPHRNFRREDNSFESRSRTTHGFG